MKEKFLLILIFLSPLVAKADLYKYVDEKGEVHFVDSPDKLPEEGQFKIGDDQAKDRPEVIKSTPSPGASDASGVADPGIGSVVPAATVTVKKKCTMAIQDKPLARVDPHKTTIFYSGTVINNGDGTARAVQVKLTVYSAMDGRILDSQTGTVTPLTIGPGDTGSFEVKANYEKIGLRNAEKDKLEALAARCD